MNPNHTNQISSRERIEFEKYVRFLILKMSQIIVQSRFGEKRKHYPSLQPSFHDWFNLAIEDNTDILIKAKEAYNNVIPLKDFCMCIEISLKTADGDTLVLEAWSLRMSTSDFFCDSPYVSYTSLVSVYCRMTLLLKSAIAVTRITPAYKLSSRQSANTYVILYRIYPGEPQVHQLGDHYQQSKIGEVLTPVGTIKMSVSYRSKDDMTITPQTVGKKSPFDVKSDYFKQDIAASKLPSGGIKIDKNLNSQRSSNDLPIAGAFAPSNKLPENDSFPELEILSKPFLNIERIKISKEKIPNHEKKLSVQNCNDNDKEKERILDVNCNANENESKRADRDTPFDFITKPSFATCDDDNDIGAFFRDCQSAPPLSSFASQPTLEEQMSGITRQIENFEASMVEYDEFVKSLDNY